MTARTFAQAGAAVVLVAREGQALETAAESIRMAGGQALAVPTDIADAAAVEYLVRTTIKTFGHLDAAFNIGSIPDREHPLGIRFRIYLVLTN